MSSYAITLWDSLKYEIFNVQEEDLAEEALIALRAIAAKLSQGLTSPDPKTALARYLWPITKECNEQLQEPQHKQAKPAGQILSSLASASTIALFLIVKAIVPPLLTLIQDADSIANQRALLEVLVQLFDSAITISDIHGAGVPAAEISNPLDPFKDRLFELSSQALMSTAHEEVSFRVMALRTLLRLCTLPRYLQDNEIGMFVQYLNEIILLENLDGRDDLKKEAIKALANISSIKPHLIRDITFPAFMAKLPDSNPADKRDYIITLEGLALLSTEKSIIDTIIRRLLNKLDTVLQHEGSCAYPQAIISSFIYILNERDLTQDPNLSTYNEKIVVGLVSRAALACAGHQQTPALTDQSMLETLGRLTTKIIRALDEHKQRSVGLQIYSLFTDEPQFVPVPYRNDATKAQRSTMILSTSLMAGVGKGVSLNPK
jgi:DNA repair/transcription protein MET18/MMS19